MIFSRLLTQRMNKAVLQFVSPQQTGFVPHSFIAENLMLLKLLQAKVDDCDEDAIYLFLDMEKARGVSPNATLKPARKRIFFIFSPALARAPEWTATRMHWPPRARSHAIRRVGS